MRLRVPATSATQARQQQQSARKAETDEFFSKIYDKLFKMAKDVLYISSF
jgi:hypothetical protein